MLSKLNTVGEWFQSEPKEGWYFDEVEFDEEARQAFEKLNVKIKVDSHSARVETGANHTYIPGHYFLYALKVQPLVILLHKYMKVFDEIKSDLANPEALANLISSISPSHAVTDALDAFSKDNFYQVFSDAIYRLQAKNIINGSGSGTSLRGGDDFIRSVILKAIPVPDASSGMLGTIIYSFSLNQEALKVLEKKYYSSIPYLFKTESGDELIFRVLSVLGWKGQLDSLFESATTTETSIDWEGLSDAFKLNTTKVSGNQSYFDEPVHYLPSVGKYVHFRRGLLDDSTAMAVVVRAIEVLWPELIIVKEDTHFLLKSLTRATQPVSRNVGGSNRIIYGAPGTGKSHSIDKDTDDKFIVRTVFHSDTQYSDFVGCLKPNMQQGKVIYRFRAGAFTKALINAVNDPSNDYTLVIEELNRAPAAAVFGDIFQLLDRKEDGSSCYFIDISDPDFLLYLNSETNNYFLKGKLQLPSNLSLVATMNSSDQAVMPLDTAFKRRWSFEYKAIDFKQKDVPNQKLKLMTSQGLYEISWAKFADKVINEMLKRFGVPEDRLIGPFYLNKSELKNWQLALSGKLFVYLWDDVLRHKIQNRNRLFLESSSTFAELYNSFPLEAVFAKEADELILEFGSAVESESE